MSKLKFILLLSGVFILTAISAFLFEEYYREFVRFFFKSFNGNKIIFVGKNFHLLPSYSFVISFGLFSVLIGIFIFRQKSKRLIANILWTFIVFCLSTMTTSYFDSQFKIAECTSCKDNIVSLHYNNINYDYHFICGLTLALIFFMLKYYDKMGID